MQLWTTMQRGAGFLCVLLTGPLVANASAGRDRFRQRDFQQHGDPLARSGVEVSDGII
jgi:hypothetical protein